MRFLRFLLKELVLHGIVFAIIGTIVLSALYFAAIGATGKKHVEKTDKVAIEQVLEDSDLASDQEIVPEVTEEDEGYSNYFEAIKGFLLSLVGKKDMSKLGPGFTSGQIILAGAINTLPLALIALVFLVLIALFVSSYAVSSRYMSLNFGVKTDERIEAVVSAVIAVLAACPLFVGFWLTYTVAGNGQGILPLIALVTVLLGGLAWDGANFLKTDMLSQINQTHAIVFSTLGRKIGKCFPLPGTYTGYLFQSSLPRFIPYLAGKVPAIIGSVTIAEIAFDFPGLGKNLIDALIVKNTDLLITSVFVLLCINAVVSFLVKLVLFLIYPRVYEKAI
ncbi:MAG: hypothetical protein IIT58_01065 [Treponema sp.]|nr:hypothetical protein [Treponema sp.]